MPSLAANSAGRSRWSSCLLNDVTSHCRTLPFRCSTRLPMLLLASLGRHHTCSSLSGSTHFFNRGQYCSSSLLRENLRNVAAISVWFPITEAPFFWMLQERPCAVPQSDRCKNRVMTDAAF